VIRQVIMLGAIAIAVTTAWLATCGLSYYEDVASGIAYLENRSFDDLTLITVGTGGAYENPRRLGPSTAVGFRGHVALVDAGRAVAEGLRAARIPVQQPDTVYLTSLLPENTVGLDDLLLTGWLAPRETPLRVVGPTGTRALTDALVAAHARSIAARGAALGLPRDGARFEVREIADGFAETRDGLAVRAAALPGGPLPALAYRFEAGGRSAVVGGSGPVTDALVALSRGADLLVWEAFHRPAVDLAIEAGSDDPARLRREADLHTATGEVGGLAQRAGVRSLVLVRLRPPPLFDLQFTNLVRESFDGRVLIAEDGDELTP
jgi:ribonuclease Z